MEAPSKVDWKTLTSEGLECQQIFFHQLQAGDTLTAIAAKHKKSHTVAVVVGNTENSLELAPEFSEGMIRSKKNNLPIILISSEDGASLKDFLNHHDAGELIAKIESKNQTHVDLKSQAASNRGSYSPEVPSKLSSKSRQSEMGRNVSVLV